MFFVHIDIVHFKSYLFFINKFSIRVHNRVPPQMLTEKTIQTIHADYKALKKIFAQAGFF